VGPAAWRYLFFSVPDIGEGYWYDIMGLNGLNFPKIACTNLNKSISEMRVRLVLRIYISGHNGRPQDVGLNDDRLEIETGK